MNRYEEHMFKRELADAQAAVSMELAKASEYRLRVAPEPMWKTRDGRIIKVAEMTDNHLLNSLRMCLRNGSYKSKVGFLKVELRRRGLMVTP